MKNELQMMKKVKEERREEKTTRGELMKRKTKLVTTVIGFGLIVFLSLFWAAANYILIPDFIVPRVKKYINENIQDPVGLSIGNIYFSFWNGFVLKDIKISGPVVLKDSYILYAETADIDLAILPIFWKRIEVLRLEMDGVDLNLGRDTSGKWNFSSILDLDIMKKFRLGGGDYEFIIRKIKLKNCFIDFLDYSDKDNMLERRYRDVQLELAVPKKRFYELRISGGSEDKKKENLELVVKYNLDKQSYRGKIKGNSVYLSEYWDYYLDDILSPWYLQADEFKMQLEFVATTAKLQLDGVYDINNGVLRYGDLSIAGKAVVKQQGKYLKDDPAGSVGSIEVDLSDITHQAGSKIILKRGKCLAEITEREIVLKELTGFTASRAINFTGKFSFVPPKQLSLNGSIGKISNNLSLLLVDNNQAKLVWESTSGNSYLKVNAEMKDFQDLVYQGSLDLNIDMIDLGGLYGAKENPFKGTISLSGNISGEADDDSLLKGELDIAVTDFSVFDLKPSSFQAVIKAEQGLFKGAIPRVEFYKGFFYGSLLVDFNRWGLELQIEDMDIADLVSGKPQYQEVKGVYTGNFIFVSGWRDLSTLSGGGYFKFSDCNLWTIPIFHDVEVGIEEVAKDNLALPDIRVLDGNFEITDNEININDVFCKAEPLRLQIKGKIGFDKEVAITAGASFSEGFLLRTARQVILPPTIGIDLLTNSFQVDIYGKLSDLKYKSGIQPMGWFNAFLPSAGTARADKYTLSKIWAGAEDAVTAPEGKPAGNQRRKQVR